MSDDVSAWERYVKAVHTIDNGVRRRMSREGAPDDSRFWPGETSPRCLRTDINVTVVDHDALLDVLWRKGVITREEYRTALLDSMERMAEMYEFEKLFENGKRGSTAHKGGTMGWWNHGADGTSLHEEPTGLVWGDGPADLIGRLMFGGGAKGAKRARRFHKREKKIGEKVVALFQQALGREPTKEEMRAGILFQFSGLRELIAGLPDGPAPAPDPTVPGLRNVGPMSEAEWEALRALEEASPEVEAARDEEYNT